MVTTYFFCETIEKARRIRLACRRKGLSTKIEPYTNDVGQLGFLVTLKISIVALHLMESVAKEFEFEYSPLGS